VSHRRSSSSVMVLASPTHRRSPVENLSTGHYAGMMQDGLQIAGPLGGGSPPPTPFHTPTLI
jgi:hypothetical protein